MERWRSFNTDFELDPRAGFDRPVLNGDFLDLTVEAAIEAAKFPIGWSGDLKPLVAWMRAGIDASVIIAAIHRVMSRHHVDPPVSFRFFDGAVRNYRGET